MLCFFRSQHDNQSWLAALSTVLDVCSLVMVGVDGLSKWQAQLTFKMARHALVDIAQVFNTSPLQHDRERLSELDLTNLRAYLSAQGVQLSSEAADAQTLQDFRALYEPYTKVLSRYLMMPLPGWMPKAKASDNWQTSAWEVTTRTHDRAFQQCMLKDRPLPKGPAVVTLQKDD